MAANGHFEFSKFRICHVTSIAMYQACFHMQNLNEITMSTAQLRSKKITFKMTAVRHLEFCICSYMVIRLASSSKCTVVYKIS